jgi:hypothetical protein
VVILQRVYSAFLCDVSTWSIALEKMVVAQLGKKCLCDVSNWIKFRKLRHEVLKDAVYSSRHFEERIKPKLKN